MRSAGVCEHVFVSGEATILHADLDAFYASVEQRDDPRLRGRPVIVGGGVVLAASYEAKAFGIRTAMGGEPGAAAVSVGGHGRAALLGVRRRRARRCSRCSRTRRRSSRDCRSTRRSSTSADCCACRARRSRSRRSCAAKVLERVGLAITVGVARTKFLAKVASGVAKPDGLLVVPPDAELEFLHPLPVQRLWGVGAVTAQKLHAPRHHDGRRRGAPRRVGARRDARARIGSASARARAQPRSAAGAGRASPRLDRIAARARPIARRRGRRRRSTRRWSRSSTA